MNPEPGSGRDPRDDADDVDKAFADIVSRWHETARDDDRRSGDATAQAAPDGARSDGGVDAASPATDKAGPTDGEVGTSAECDRAELPSNSQPDDAVPPARPRTVEEVFGQRPGTGWRVHTPPEEPEEHFVPPSPAPLPSHDLSFWGALFGLVGGPVWIIWLAVAAPAAHRLWLWLAVATTLGGFALLVMRLPARRDPEGDDSDDGAVV